MTSSTVIIVRASKTRLRQVNRRLKTEYGATRVDRRLKRIAIFRLVSGGGGIRSALNYLRGAFAGLTFTLCTVVGTGVLTPTQCRAEFHKVNDPPLSISPLADGKPTGLRRLSKTVAEAAQNDTPDLRSVGVSELAADLATMQRFLAIRATLAHGLFRSSQFLHHQLKLQSASLKSISSAADVIRERANGRAIVGLGFATVGDNQAVALAIALGPKGDHDSLPPYHPTSVKVAGLGVVAAVFVLASRAIYTHASGGPLADNEHVVSPVAGEGYGTIGATISAAGDLFGVSCGHVFWNGESFASHAKVHSSLHLNGQPSVPVVTSRCEMPTVDPENGRDIAVFGPLKATPAIRELQPPFNSAISFLGQPVALIGAASGSAVGLLEIVMAIFEVNPHLYGGPVILKDLLLAQQFTKPGDSGALWLAGERQQPVGIHTLIDEYIDGRLYSCAQSLSCLSQQF